MLPAGRLARRVLRRARPVGRRGACRLSAARRAEEVSGFSKAAASYFDAFYNPSGAAEIAAETAWPAGETDDDIVRQVVEQLQKKDGESSMDVKLRGSLLELTDGRRLATVRAPVGPQGQPSEREFSVVMPSKQDVLDMLDARPELPADYELREKWFEPLEKFYSNYLDQRTTHVAMNAAWHQSPISASKAAWTEIAALMAQSLRSSKAAQESSRTNFRFNIDMAGKGKDALVMPPSNFAMLGIKDIFHMWCNGYRVIAVVQPHFYPHFKLVQEQAIEAGIPEDMLEVFPGITPDADPEVLHEILRRVGRLQFTGSSNMFGALVKKAIDMGNTDMEYAGEVSGLNKFTVEGVDVNRASVREGLAWAISANNGELCTSTSYVEADPSTFDALKSAVEGVNFPTGLVEDPSTVLVKRSDKASNVDVVVDQSVQLKEWWEKKALVGPANPDVRTSRSLGYCVYAPTVEEALEKTMPEYASCLYAAGCEAPDTAPQPRVGTTGAQVPQSVFGGMKTFTNAVGGDHDGVGSVQSNVYLAKSNSFSWRDNEEPASEYELSDRVEMLLDFLEAEDQKSFVPVMTKTLDIMWGLAKEEPGPVYYGQPMSNSTDGARTKMITLRAIKQTRLQPVLTTAGSELPADVIKLAIMREMSPFTNSPVHLHILTPFVSGGLRQLVDPLKSFLRVAPKLGWTVHEHADWAALVAHFERDDGFPPYLLALPGQKKHIALDLLKAVAGRMGYVYESMESDPLHLFRQLTTTQAWSAAVDDEREAAARSKLRELWISHGLKHGDEGYSSPVPGRSIRPGKKANDDFGNFDMDM